ncbi:UDP-glucose/GDP-mannose dehydrogenase family protein [bacterium]|nr:UDP-glucose/GDP-mannose dehydrogenase family protein [bacterium]
MKENITIIGIGKLGLCFGLNLAHTNCYNVLGVDKNQEYVDAINQKQLASDEMGVNELLQHVTDFHATTDLKVGIEHSKLIFIVVATPSLPSGDYDVSQVTNLFDKILLLDKPKEMKDLVVCCTVSPRFCSSQMSRMLSHNYKVSYNPEFIAQGTIIRDQRYPDMVLIGEFNQESGDKIQSVYQNLCMNKPRYARMSTDEAELTKISLNCFLTTKIAYANMIGDIAVASGCNPDVILSAISADSRIGDKCMKYGYGFGGPCLPRDNRALSIFAELMNVPTHISVASDLQNETHLYQQVEQFVKSHKQKSLVKLGRICFPP